MLQSTWIIGRALVSTLLFSVVSLCMHQNTQREWFSLGCQHNGLTWKAALSSSAIHMQPKYEFRLTMQWTHFMYKTIQSWLDLWVCVQLVIMKFRNMEDIPKCHERICVCVLLASYRLGDFEGLCQAWSIVIIINEKKLALFIWIVIGKPTNGHLKFVLQLNVWTEAGQSALCNPEDSVMVRYLKRRLCHPDTIQGFGRGG